MDNPDPVLADLSRALERAGDVVVPHGDHVCIRLPLAASVRVYAAGDRLRLVPKFGPFRRTRGLLFTSTISTAAVGVAAFALGAAPATILVAFLGVVALAHDACRFILTENCVTRVQQLVSQPRMAMLEPPTDAQSNPALASHAGISSPGSRTT